MGSSQKHILQRQTRLIATLCGIILVLLFVIFLLGYCQPQYRQQNAAPATGGTNSATVKADSSAMP